MKNISCWAFRALFPEATDSYTEMLNLKELVTLKRRVLVEQKLVCVASTITEKITGEL